jgi:hypothetical protein
VTTECKIIKGSTLIKCIEIEIEFNRNFARNRLIIKIENVRGFREYSRTSTRADIDDISVDDIFIKHMREFLDYKRVRIPKANIYKVIVMSYKVIDLIKVNSVNIVQGIRINKDGM